MSQCVSEVPAPVGGVTVSVLLFGKLADRLGRELSVSIPAGGCTVGELRLRLCEGREGAREVLMRSDVRAAVDRVIVADKAWVSRGCEVAFLPIFSGG